MGVRSYLGREIFPVGVWRAYGEVGIMRHRLAEMIDEGELKEGFFNGRFRSIYPRREQ